jgi:hypothetical protein
MAGLAPQNVQVAFPNANQEGDVPVAPPVVKRRGTVKNAWKNRKIPDSVYIISEEVKLNEGNVSNTVLVSFREKYLRSQDSPIDQKNIRNVFGRVFHPDSTFNVKSPKPPCSKVEYDLLKRGLERRRETLLEDIDRERAKLGIDPNVANMTVDNLVVENIVTHHNLIVEVINALDTRFQLNRQDCDPSVTGKITDDGFDGEESDIFTNFSYLVLLHMKEKGDFDANALDALLTKNARTRENVEELMEQLRPRGDVDKNILDTIEHLLSMNDEEEESIFSKGLRKINNKIGATVGDFKVWNTTRKARNAAAALEAAQAAETKAKAARDRARDLRRKTEPEIQRLRLLIANRAQVPQHAGAQTESEPDLTHKSTEELEADLKKLEEQHAQAVKEEDNLQRAVDDAEARVKLITESLTNAVESLPEGPEQAGGAADYAEIKEACKAYQSHTTELLHALKAKGIIRADIPELTDDNVEDVLSNIIHDVKSNKTTESICGSLKKGNRRLIAMRKKFSRLQRKRPECMSVLDELIEMF